MPYINTTTTKKLDKAQRDEIKAELGQIIAEIPGKSENWLMVGFCEGAAMYFRGDDSADSAYVEVSILGRADADAYERITARICDLFERKLGISPDRVYVKYEEAEYWGWNGANF